MSKRRGKKQSRHCCVTIFSQSAFFPEDDAEQRKIDTAEFAGRLRPVF